MNTQDNRKPRRLLAVLAGLAVALVVAAGLFFRDTAGGEVRNDDGAEQSATEATDRRNDEHSGYLWQAGAAIRYTFTYATRSATTIPGTSGPMEGRADIEGELVIAVDEVDGDGTMSGRMRIDAVTAGEIFLSESQAVNRQHLQASLSGVELRLRVDRCGRVLNIAAPTGDAELGHHLLQTLVQDSRFSVCGPGSDTGSFTAREISPHGHLIATYRLGDGEVTRSEVEYQTLQVANGAVSGANVAVMGRAQLREGVLQDLHASETIRWEGESDAALAISTRVSMRRVETTHEATQRPEAVVWLAPDERPRSADTAERLLHRRAEGLSGEQLVERVASHVGGDGPGFREFMWRAPARVAVEPALVGDLVAQAANPEALAGSRSLALDILAQAPSQEAALGLLDALQSAAVRDDFRYPILLQRASFVSNPPAELVDWVRTKSHSDDPNEAGAATYSLGSLVAALDLAGRSDEADDAHSELLTRTLAATTGDDRANYLRALANARRISDIATFAEFAEDPHNSVRVAVASAFEDLPGAASLAFLPTLIRDRDTTVQRAALLALRPQPVVDGALTEVADAVEGGYIVRRNERTLLEAMTLEIDRDPASVMRIANAMSELTSDSQVRAASALLAQRAAARL